MRSCLVCGTSLEDRSPLAKTCSTSCNNKKAFAGRMAVAASRRTISRSHFYNVKLRAERKGIEFGLTFGEIPVPDVCPITLEPLVTHGKRAGNNKPSIDRIDNTKGYVPDNIAIISCGANRAKSNLGLDAVRRLLTYMEAQVA